MTLSWDDNGYRVLPAAAYMDHTERMRQLSNQFTPAIDARRNAPKSRPISLGKRTRARFLAALGMTRLGTQQFGQLGEEARVRLGGLFRSEDYPAPEELPSKFSFETKVMPLPDAGDFRVSLTRSWEALLTAGSRDQP
jgi:hypothetical protein